MAFENSVCPSLTRFRSKNNSPPNLIVRRSIPKRFLSTFCSALEDRECPPDIPMTLTTMHCPIHVLLMLSVKSSSRVLHQLQMKDIHLSISTKSSTFRTAVSSLSYSILSVGRLSSLLILSAKKSMQKFFPSSGFKQCTELRSDSLSSEAYLLRLRRIVKKDAAT